MDNDRLDVGLFSLTCQETVLFRLFTSIFTSIITSPGTVIGPRQFSGRAFPLLSFLNQKWVTTKSIPNHVYLHNLETLSLSFEACVCYFYMVTTY